MVDESAAPLEPQEDEEDLDLAGGFDAAIAASDWTAETIVSQLKKGNINLDPSFQRRDAWKRPRKSSFIESLIVGIPIPQIILAERRDKRGSYIVIDGKQRLLALRQFTADADDPDFEKFRLGSLALRDDLNGLDFDDLKAHRTSPAVQLENATIRTVIIKSWPSEDYLYEVFLRINSGSVQLSPQELRQALNPGPFTIALNQITIDNDEVRSILNIDEPDFRMRDNELVLRYLAFSFFLPEYRGNLKGILDLSTKFFNENWGELEVRVRHEVERMSQSILVTQNVFGNNAFKKWNGAEYESRLNRAVFDVVAYYFSFIDIADEAQQNADAVEEKFREICAPNTAFVESVSGTTKSIEAVRNRFSIWGEALDDVLETKVEIPELP